MEKLPKSFLVRFEKNNCLWSKYLKWLRDEYHVETNYLTFHLGTCCGIESGVCITAEAPEASRVLDVPVIALEEWDRLVNGFVLPEKWCVEYCREAFDYIKNNINQNISSYNKELCKDRYLCIDTNKKGFKSYHFYRKNSINFNDYTKITSEQFKKYVLRENVNESIVDKMKSYQVFQNINDHFQRSLAYSLFPIDLLEKRKKVVYDNIFSSTGVPPNMFDISLTSDKYSRKVYTIKDLSEGKVAVVNDGTIEQLATVLKAAFPNDIISLGGDYKYYLQSSNISSWWCRRRDTDLPTQSVKEFIKQIKTENMDDSRFPFKLKVNDAQTIIDWACSNWREKLVVRWAKQMLIDKIVVIEEPFYKEMRKACTNEQHELFDEIFGKDEELFKVGDWVVWRDGYVGKIKGRCSHFPDSWNIRLDGSSSGKYSSCNGEYLRKATPEEIAKAQCPYEDGELCWVKDFDLDNWTLRYATGTTNEQGEPAFYSTQNYNPFSGKFAWNYHKSAKGVELPKD